MNRLLSAAAFAAFAFAASAADTLLPGSIRFTNPELWGKSVKYGLDDDGGTTGITRWYADESDGDNDSRIVQHAGRPNGYLVVDAPNGVHRTLRALTQPSGPSEDQGMSIPSAGLYLDTVVSMTAYADFTEKRLDAADKIVCWIYVPESGGTTNFVVTAGRLTATGVEPANYVTAARVAPGENMHVTIKAIADASTDPARQVPGFAVYVDGELVTCDAGDYDAGESGCLDGGELFGRRAFFPSMVAADGSVASTSIYSLGFSGSCTAEKVNFTRVDPAANEDYDKPDLSMLQEAVEFTVSGYETSYASLFGFPLLVRISEESIENFRYSRTKSDGSDIRFTDENGELLDHEIDTWNPGGESLAWVKMPYMRNGVRVTMYWSLKDGTSAPSVDSRRVWSDYVAVWHMSQAGATGVMRDSTGHGYNAVVTNGTLIAADSAPIGVAARLDSTSGRESLAAESHESVLSGGEFTFTGWYLAHGYGGGQTYPFCGTKADAERTDESGWCGVVWGRNAVSLHYSGDDTCRYSATDVPAVDQSWFHLALSRSSSGSAELYMNGERFAAGAFPVAGSGRPFQLMLNGFCGDEIRVAREAKSQDWIHAEYLQASMAAFLSPGAAAATGTANYWVDEPFVKPVAWTPAEASSVEVFRGTPRYGKTVLAWYDSHGNRLADMPTALGAYKAVFTADDGIHDVLSEEVSFVIFEPHSYDAIHGYGRVMLFNSDETPGHEVGLQGFYDVDSATNAVWTHSTEAWKGTGRFVKPGTTHVYREPGTGAKLWEFRNARIGNLFQSDTGLAARMNFLPWSTNADRYDDSEKRARSQRYAGTLILRNASLSTTNDPAAAYSPYYTNGIGTVYFDAVNAHCGYTNRIAVQICRTDDVDVRLGAWKSVPATAFAVVNGRIDGSLTQESAAETLLGMNKSAGTTNWFYRVRVPVNVDGGVRFRIVRTDDELGWGAGGDDGPGLVSIDNIIASPPAMGVTLEHYGAPADPSNAAFRGQRAPFVPAFPTAEDLGTMLGRVKVNYIVNGTNTVDGSWLGSLSFFYRWRYLNQSVGKWKELPMGPSGEDGGSEFVTSEPLVGDGIGDIEYRCRGVVNAPFYEYHDYSGMAGIVWPDGYTERRGNANLDAVEDGVYSETDRSPALGTDYFVRLREGYSPYEGLAVYVRKADESAASAVRLPMELVSTNTWRAFYQTVTNVEGGVCYRVEAYNRQDSNYEYGWTTNFYFGSDHDEMPVNDVLTEGSADDWTTIPCDALTGYILFQVDDSTKAVTIIRADYQNFNSWTDANRADGDLLGHFVGTSTAEDARTGAARTAKTFADGFEDYFETIATNRLWEEHFDETVSTNGTWAIDRHFTGKVTTPNGWGAENGMWVPQRYRQLGDVSMALQMDGEGAGSLLFQVLRQPRGVANVAYAARIAQSYELSSFNYYRGTNDYYNLDGYTFAVPCAMKAAKDDDFEGAGAISVVGHYDDSRGCYEMRVERVSATEVQLCLYKWYYSGSMVRCDLVGRSDSIELFNGYSGLGGENNRYSAMFISCQSTFTSVRVQAGILSSGLETINSDLRGLKYYRVCFEDTSLTQLRSGTFGVGSCSCPAVFVRPMMCGTVPEWPSMSLSAASRSGDMYWWDVPRTVNFGDEPRAVLNYEEDYDKWDVRVGRLDRKGLSSDAPGGWYGFKARVPVQSIVVEATPRTTQNWRPVATNAVTSFGFSIYTNLLYITADTDIQLRTAGEKGDRSPDVVIDDVAASQWRGEDYDDAYSPNRSRFYNIAYGAPSNFVYTAGWVTGDGAIELSAMRTSTSVPASIRSPLMDGYSPRGIGLGSISFSYRNADSRARVIVQVATNGVDVTGLADLTKRVSSGWTDVATYDFSAMSAEDRRSGVLSCYLGLHGVTGVMRIVIDPTLVSEAQSRAYNPGWDPAYGSIFITSVSAKDNPVVDTGSWWGWNLRTTDDASKWLLRDATASDASAAGMSLGLNDSVVDDCRADEDYTKHMPFLQTPVFTEGVIGEVSFKARKYSASDPPATVAIYGTMATTPVTDDADFEYIDEILVDCDRYETFSYRAPLSRNYTGFRFAVTGVDGVVGDKGPDPRSGVVARVLLDEVAIFESIRARMGFRNVGAFRDLLETDGYVPGVPGMAQQPLSGEAWGVQAEVYAVQLSDQIDTSREPKVRLHWMHGTTPWGFEKWRGSAAAHSAELAPAAGTNGVYRSSYLTAPDAVIPATNSPGIVVQYALEVEYWMKDSGDESVTNTLQAGEWTNPEWYSPVDYNREIGGGESFSAYTILDSVAPGWAWINEMNVFGTYDMNWRNSDDNCQYVEIAAPAEADLTGWQLRMLNTASGTDSVVTNIAAVFGDSGLAGTKPGLLGAASNMVFRVIANKASRSSGRLKMADGTLDGVWSFPNPNDIFMYTGEIYACEPFGVQLVRPSGVVEHEIVVLGTNFWDEAEAADNVASYFNSHIAGARFFHAGDDCGGEPCSLGVWDSRGEAVSVWTNMWVRTPGYINTNLTGGVQNIDPDHPTPRGSAIIVYANLGSGNITQSVGDAVDSRESQILILQRGSYRGTNIVYKVDPWYELGQVTTNGAVASPVSTGARTYELNVGMGASNNVTVVASAVVDHRLRELGCDENNKYTPAVIDWLVKGTMLKDVYGTGQDWPDSDGEIYLARWTSIKAGFGVRDMTLTQMYWLDICPTISNQLLVAGVYSPTPHIVTKTDGSSLTNVRMTVFMMLTNDTETVSSPYYGKAWAPYVIRGLEPGSTSWGYSASSDYGWTNASFKVTGILANGQTHCDNENNWIPLRWFVFDDESFRKPDGPEPEKAFTADVELLDPYSTESPAYSEGWGTWVQEHGFRPVYYSWRLNTRLRPFGVEILRPNSYYGDSAP